MISENDYKKSEWRLNTEKYLFLLSTIEKLYKDKKINRKQKKEIEERITFLFKKNYWKLNPNLKEPLLAKIFNSMFNTFYIS